MLATFKSNTSNSLTKWNTIVNGRISVSVTIAHSILDETTMAAGIRKLIDMMLAGSSAADGKSFFGRSRGIFAAIVAASTSRMIEDGAVIHLLSETALKGVKVGMERFIAQNPNSPKIPEVKKALAATNAMIVSGKF
jgi:hypothetical protein